MTICGYGCARATFSALRASLHPAPSFQLKYHVTPASSQTSFTLRTRHRPSSGLCLFWTFSWNHIQLFHLEGSANGDLFDGLSFLKRKKPDLQKQSTVAYVWQDCIAHLARWMRWESGAFSGSWHSLSLQPLRNHTSDVRRTRMNRMTLCKLKEIIKKTY